MRFRFCGGSLALPIINRDLQGPVSMILLGIMILADWISSGNQFVDAEQWIGSPHAGQIIETKTREFLQKSTAKVKADKAAEEKKAEEDKARFLQAIEQSGKSYDEIMELLKLMDRQRVL